MFMFKSKALIQLNQIDDGDSAAVTATIDGVKTNLIVVRQGQQAFVYINVCPHIGAPLDFEPGRFLNLEKDLIQCSVHGALFTIDVGNCVQGPCIGKHLTPVPTHIKKGAVFLD